MDIEVKRMSPTAIEMLDQLSVVCKRFNVECYRFRKGEILCGSRCPARISTEKSTRARAEAFRSASVSRFEAL